MYELPAFIDYSKIHKTKVFPSWNYQEIQPAWHTTGL